MVPSNSNHSEILGFFFPSAPPILYIYFFLLCIYFFFLLVPVPAKIPVEGSPLTFQRTRVPQPQSRDFSDRWTPPLPPLPQLRDPLWL